MFSNNLSPTANILNLYIYSPNTLSLSFFLVYVSICIHLFILFQYFNPLVRENCWRNFFSLYNNFFYFGLTHKGKPKNLRKTFFSFFGFVILLIFYSIHWRYIKLDAEKLVTNKGGGGIDMAIQLRFFFFWEGFPFFFS